MYMVYAYRIALNTPILVWPMPCSFNKQTMADN